MGLSDYMQYPILQKSCIKPWTLLFSITPPPPLYICLYLWLDAKLYRLIAWHFESVDKGVSEEKQDENEEAESETLGEHGKPVKENLPSLLPLGHALSTSDVHPRKVQRELPTWMTCPHLVEDDITNCSRQVCARTYMWKRWYFMKILDWALFFFFFSFFSFFVTFLWWISKGFPERELVLSLNYAQKNIYSIIRYFYSMAERMVNDLYQLSDPYGKTLYWTTICSES